MLAAQNMLSKKIGVFFLVFCCVVLVLSYRYSFQETEEPIRHIPFDCVAERILWASHAVHIQSLGTDILAMVNLSAAAKMSHRTVIFSGKWPWARKNVDCENNTMDCWFAPQPNCKIEDHADVKQCVDIDDCVKSNALVSQCRDCIYSNDLVYRQEFDDEIYAKAASTLLRPNPVLKELIKDSMEKIKSAGSGSTFVSFHVDRDTFWKARSSNMLMTSSYLSQIVDLAVNKNVETIYISVLFSPLMKETIAEVRGAFATLAEQLEFLSPNVNLRVVHNVHVKLTDYVTSFLVDLFINSESDYFFGPKNSDFSKLVALLRKANGRSNTTILLEDEYPDLLWQPEDSFPYDGNWDFEKFASNFECYDENWCDTYFEPTETIETQLSMYKWQYPSNCSGLRFMAQPAEQISGIGSAVHVRGQLMTGAFVENRVFVVADYAPFIWADVDYCGAERGSQDCWLKPVSTCSVKDLPADWKSFYPKNRNMNLNPNSTESVRFLCVWNEVNGCKYMGIPYNRIKLVPPYFGTTDYYWWHSQVSKFTMRPSLRTQQVTRQIQIETFPPSGVMPHPIFSIFIRRGDKHLESAPKSIKSYMDLVIPMAEEHNVWNIYLGSDDQSVVDDVIRTYGKQFKIFSMNASRYSEEYGKQFKPTERLQAGTLKNNEMIDQLADLYIAIQGDIFVGTRSSNRCRMIDELRKVNGKARIPFLSPETILYDA